MIFIFMAEMKIYLKNFLFCYILKSMSAHGQAAQGFAYIGHGASMSINNTKRMDVTMVLLETWRNLAYGDGLDDKKREELWAGYFQIEKGIYEQILSDPTQVITGTVKELAETYGTELLIMTGFLDGINESLKDYENPIDTMEEDTLVKIEIDPEKLYYNMVEAKADWLYQLPMWDSILTEERRRELYKAQKASGTIRKEKKVFPNDPCPCGSGKKYKKCCGRNVK